MLGSLGTSLHAAPTSHRALTQQQVAWRVQHGLAPTQRFISQTVVTCVVTGKACSLHQRCSYAFHSSPRPNQSNHPGMHTVLSFDMMHFTSSFMNHIFACTGSGVSYVPMFGQRATPHNPVSCSASTVDQFGRSNDASLQSGVPAVLSNLQALYQFSRPHTMLGTFISICSVSLLAMVCSCMAQMHTAYCFLPALMLVASL